MSKAFWATVRQQIAELRTATSADDVLRILFGEGWTDGEKARVLDAFRKDGS